MNNKIKIGIIGVGCCCSSLVQGIQYYKNITDNETLIPGLMNPVLGGYKISDIEVVVAYDIDARKVGKHLEEAIFQPPNNTKIFYRDIPKTKVIVKMGIILDGFSSHLLDYDEKYRIILSTEQEPSKEDVIGELKRSGCQILLIYCPVGSTKATEFYAECCLEAGVSLINNIPVFIASDTIWANRFQEKGIPLLGDDIKSQLGATETHRILTQMIIDRGGKIDNTWQLNIGGNSDFLNMTDSNRLKSKRISKTESIKSLIPYDAYVYAGPNGFIGCLNDNKICHLRIDFRIFGNVPCSLDVKLSVEDSPNSAGIIIDAIRLTKIALDRGIGGPLIPACAYYMKHPPEQMREEIARRQLEDFINGDREN